MNLRKHISAVRRVSTELVSRIVESFDLRDIHAYGGLAMLGYGLHMIHPAAAWALCGLLMFWLGVRR